MATAESVKLKIQNLIARANTTTGKEDKDLTLAVNTLIEGYSQIRVIEVEELPEVGETGVVYKLVKKDLIAISVKNEEGEILPDSTATLIYLFSGGEMTLPDEFYNYVKEPDIENFSKESIYYVESEDALYQYDTDNNVWASAKNGGEEGFCGTITSIDQITADSPIGTYALIKIEYEYYEYVLESFKTIHFKAGSFIDVSTIFPILSVPTRSTENFIKTCMYYIEDEDVFLQYDSDTETWVSGVDGEDLKVINSADEVTEDGSYIIRSGNFIKYLNPTHTQTITESGIYNVEDVAVVNVAYDSVCGTWKLSEIDIGKYEVVSINFTTIYEDKVVKCTGMQSQMDLTDPDKLVYILEDGTKITAHDGYTWSYETAKYVDFGEERQNVPKYFADFVRKGTPIYDLLVEVETEEVMNALLEIAEEGTVYRYTGPTTENYENGALYVVHTPMVSFTIDGADHQGEEDMTWTEWCASEYNTIGCVNADAEELIYNSDNTKQLMLNDVAVYGKDVLAAGAAYVFITIPVEEPSTEEPNEYGTTVIVNQYGEEDNDYGTTVVIGEEDEVNLITFTIADVEYQAEENMTWSEWVDSDYNTNGFIKEPYRILSGDSAVAYSGSDVLPSATIVADKAYTLNQMSSG